MSKNMLILGGTSDISRAVALKFANDKYSLHLAGRDLSKLKRFAKDLEVRTSQQVSCHHFDVLSSFSEHTTFWNSISGSVDVVFCAIGCLGDQIEARSDLDLAQTIIDTNYAKLVGILSLIANTFEKRQNGLLIVVSSVAGERGRASNYVYGSAKAGLTAFLSGLRQRLAVSNVRVITVLPGFVDTAMTEHLNLPKLLTSSPNYVAEIVLNAVRRKKDVIYVGWYWKFIMLIIKCIPERIFRQIRNL